MHGNEIRYFGGQSVFSGKFESLFHMGFHNQRTQLRLQRIMLVFPAALVLNIIFRLGHLPDVVIVGTDPRQQRIRAHCLRCRFRQIPHNHTVMIGTRRPHG